MSMSVSNSTTYLNPSTGGNRYSSASTTELVGSEGSRSSKTFKILIAGLSVLVLILVIVLAVVASKGLGPTPKPPEVCYSPQCRDAAARFLTNMNMKADPCNDFFGFVCGKWVEDTRIPEEKSRYGVFEALQDNLAETCIESLKSPEAPDVPTTAVNNSRAFYQACMNTENVDKGNGVSQLRDILQRVNISSDVAEVPTEFDVYKALTEITKTYGLNFIIAFGVGPDDKATTNNIIILDQPATFGLGRNFLLGNETDPRVKAYKTYITESLCLLNTSSTTDCSYLKSIVDDIFSFEVNIAKMTRDLVDRRSAWTWYFKMTFGELHKNVTKIDFLQYSKDILGDKGAKLTNDTEIIVKEETYFLKLSEYLEKASKSVQSNYLAWRLIQSFGPSLFKDFRTIQFRFNQVNEGISRPQDIKNICFDKTNTYFGHAVGRLYVDIAFDEKSKKDVEDMVANLAEAFRGLLNQINWMDEVTKSQSRTKVDKMIDMIGFPEWTKNDEELNKFYNVKAMNKTDFLGSLVNIVSFLVEKSFAQLDKLNNRTQDWVTQASIVNAYYNPSANSITFPAGILQFPFYGKYPKFLNYGAIGYVIGHEITHGYDDQGSEFDGDGNLKNWWTDNTREEFNKRKQCFIDQYTSIVDPLSGKHLNGSQTIGENIADNGGIREAYQAYLLSGKVDERLPGLEMYSDLQMFFMSAASVWCTKFRKEGMENIINNGVHAPGIYRAYIPLSNTDEFAQVFNCPEGSTMNPKTRCRIW